MELTLSFPLQTPVYSLFPQPGFLSLAYDSSWTILYFPSTANDNVHVLFTDQKRLHDSYLSCLEFVDDELNIEDIQVARLHSG